jgi:hypothetical protein
MMYPSGLWRGYWEQPLWGRQFMDDFTLKFHDGVVSGGGRDVIGLFLIKGEYQGTHVSFVKQYVGKHKVVYAGEYDGEGTIHGRWHILGNGAGPFALSPTPPKSRQDAPIQEIAPKR